MEFAPVAVFAYKRLDHLRRTLESLNDSAIASESDLFVFCDGYKNENDKEDVMLVRRFVMDFKKTSKFKTVNIIFSENNNGLAASIINGVTDIINRFGKVIVVEDDLETAPCFLPFINQALDYYSGFKDVWSVCGFSFSDRTIQEIESDVYFTGRASSWGWGTWRDRWNSIDWAVSDYGSFKHNWHKRYAFGKWGTDLPLMLDQQMNKNIDSWAIRWCYSQFKQKKLSVFPKQSLVKNIGLDGSGVHQGKMSSFDTELSECTAKRYTFLDPHIDKRIKRAYASKYGIHGFAFFKMQIKALLQRIGLLKY